tara:strand:+ start:74 stop:199 length:126 start_codon:yes stop_codon:yes gene_type:complete
MAKTVLIELDFDRDDIDDDDVYEYLFQALENYTLYWEIKEQ